MVERSRRPSVSINKKVFTYGLLIVVVGELIAMILYLLSGNGPAEFFLLLFIIGVLIVAVRLANIYQMKGSFIYAALLAVIGGCSTGNSLSNYKQYLQVPHVENVSLKELIDDPENYDAIQLFYFDDAIVRADLAGINTVKSSQAPGTQSQNFKVYPIVPLSQANDSIKNAGAWLVSDYYDRAPAETRKQLDGQGLARITYEYEPYYRGAVYEAEKKYGIESDWNAPILARVGDKFKKPKQFYHVIFLALFWPLLWVFTRVNLLMKKQVSLHSETE